jgi:hypothetical protein
MTGFARALPWYLNFFLGAGDGFLETKGYIVAKIFTASATSAAAVAAKELAKDVTEDIFETCSEVESAGKRTAITESCVTELVVLRTLLWFGENLVGLGNFLEFLLRLFVTRVAVRVILERKFPVSFLDLVLAGVAVHTEQIVILFLFAQVGTSIEKICIRQKAPLLNQK